MRWLKSLPPGSITTWEQCRAMFLDKFYTKQKTASLRSKITNFCQNNSEPVSEAWARFREYQRECPHHGYSDEHLLNIFYDGANWNVKNSLNAASNGDFMTRTQEEAYTLIENLAASSSNLDEEYDRSRKGGNSESKKIEEMSAKIDMLMQRDQRVVSAIEDYGGGAFNFPNHEPQEQQGVANYGDVQNFEQAAVNYIGGQNYPQTRGPNQGFQQPAYGQNQAQRFPQGQQGYQNPNNYQGGYQQNQPFNSFQPQNPAQIQTGGSSVPGAQGSKLEAMMQQLMINQQKSATEINKKVDTIFQDMNNKWESLSAHVKKLEAQVAQTAEAVKRPTGVLPGRGESNPRKEYVNAITLRYGEEYEVQAEEEEAAEDTPPMVRVYKPKLPYPVRQREPDINLEKAKCKEMGSKTNEKLSIEDAVEMTPTSPKMTDKASPMDSVMSISERCSTLLQNKVPEKMEDPGSFVLSCEIEGAKFEKSLCDLGSSVNLMPYTVAKRLGLTDFKSTNIQLEFADHSVRHPVGMILDVDVMVGNLKIPADFVVLELDHESKDPLILGRPFLATAGAVIDVKKGKIDLHLGDIAMKFEVEKMLKRPTLDGHTFSINHASKDDEVGEELLRNGIIPGKKVSERGTKVDKAKVEIMMSLRPPDPVKGKRSLLDNTKHYKKFIQNFSKISRPLTRLLCKGTKFRYDEKRFDAYHTTTPGGEDDVSLEKPPIG